MPFVKGKVEHVIYQSGTYKVLAFKTEETDALGSRKKTTVSGHLCGLETICKGLPLHLVGEWSQHPKYGSQFSIHGWYPWAAHRQDVIFFLSYGTECFPDYPLVKKIVTEFGLDTYEVLLKEPSRVLALVSDTERNGLDFALAQWGATRSLADLAYFLQDYGMGPDSATAIFSLFGHNSVKVVSENPYRLLVVDGFSFPKADELAKKLGIAKDDPRRIEGAVLWVLRNQAQQGHLFVRRGDLSTLLQSLAGADFGDIQVELEAATERMLEEKVLVLDTEAGIYLPTLHQYERESAEMLAHFLSPSEIEVDLDSFIEAYHESNQIVLSPAQQEAVRKLSQSHVLVLTGGPGTGKTSLVKAFIKLFKDAGISFALMAPTGIAAKRLSVVTGEPAQTIHRAFGYNGQEWSLNKDMPLCVGAVILDEASMIDMELFYRILSALDPSTILVVVGDDAQLPSVGPGNVLRELLSCPEIPNVHLTQIFRQAATSEIVVASHKINRGENPLPQTRDPDSDFQFVKFQDEEQVAEFIVEAASKLKNRNANFQVIAPKYDGVVGVNNLNKLLREKLNPSIGQLEWSFGDFQVREGDRLMVVKNNYQLGIYNGDAGKLIALSKSNLTLRIHGVGGGLDTQVILSKDVAPNILKLAYAVTVHRMQGSEYETILFPLVRSQGRMLQRNLFYTGLTRAKKKVWLLGDSSAVIKAVSNNKVVQRNTILGQLISSYFSKLSGVRGET